MHSWTAWNRARGSSMTRRPCVSPTAAHYDAETLKRQTEWRVCCASCDVHRFDCPVGTRRGEGPFLKRGTGR